MIRSLSSMTSLMTIIFLIGSLVILISNLRRMDTFFKYFAISTKGGIFCDVMIAYCTPIPFRKGVYSKRKKLAPVGSIWFPFRVDPFSEERKKTYLTELSALKVKLLWPFFIWTSTWSNLSCSVSTNWLQLPTNKQSFGRCQHTQLLGGFLPPDSVWYLFGESSSNMSTNSKDTDRFLHPIW